MPPTPSRPRIEPISPPYPAALAEDLDRVSPSWRDTGPLAIFRVWARHPSLGRAIAPVGSFLLQKGEVEPPDRELIILRTCALAGAEYEWGVHAVGYAPRSGLDDTTIEATACSPTDDPRWSERQRLLLRLVDEFESSIDVSDGLWHALEQSWTETQLLELLLIAGFYRFVAFSVRATRTPLEDWAKRFPDDRLAAP